MPCDEGHLADHVPIDKTAGWEARKKKYEAYARHGVTAEHCAAGSVILDVTLDGDLSTGGGASGDAGSEHGWTRDDSAVSLAAMLTPSGNLQLMVSKEERRGLAMRLQRGARAGLSSESA